MYSLSSLMFAAVLAHGVIAGSRMWEAPLHYPSVDAPVEITLNLEGVNVTQVGTHSINSTEKRWVTIKDGGGRLARSFKWPNKKIRFHYETEEAKEKLEVYLDAAKALWSAAGLPDDFTYEEVTSETDYEAKKGQILQIKYNDRNYLGTTLGLPTQDDGGTRPMMDLCDSDKIGTLNIVANFAHELGHAWGLHHEHQNPQFWAIPHTETKGDRVQFGPGYGEFRCESLSDYQATKTKLVERYGEGEGNARLRQSCLKRKDAIRDEFRGAIEWLPLDPSEDFVGSVKEFDERSIMLYPSRAGGSGTANGQGADDGRAVVLTRADGKELDYNTAPSEQDVQGIRKLYGVPRKTYKSLLSELKDPSNSRFTDERLKDEGSSCNT
ncbi:hypothetical protein CGLO_05067 [Colletotrichum gloeosporioides Cg-14]|uniref:Peptidase metallopeptidase domain-containing protein n=1 Tax=Colletotrichum gloeosporioides (strain Cg-14) TaxID=1237896 RepID=T0LTF7_COLGC|nr:hypothetical protein CGLO_05067 [Colletotrichum gloeosporioides Cg-14]